MKLPVLRFAPSRVGILCVVLCLSAACQRTPIQIDTGGAPSATPATAAPGAERQAVVQEVSGTVEVRATADGAWAAAQVGDRLAQGSQVRTQADGRALLLLTEGSKIRVNPGTAFTFKILNPYLDSLLTSLELAQGKVWVLLSGGALDVETPLGIASARAAYLSAAFDPKQNVLQLTCLQGTCSFGDRFIPGGSKFEAVKNQATGPVEMGSADYGEWGVQVPEATQLAWLATEAVVQGSATLPVVATPTASRTPRPKPSVTAKPGLPPASATVPATAPAPATPTAPVVPPPPTARPFTPIPPAPIMGQHVVLKDETLFCIARAYGVLPAAIAQANGLFLPFNVTAGQMLVIPEVQWVNVAPGPVCPPQFASLYPGLTVDTPAPTAIGLLTVVIKVTCTANCDVLNPDYLLHIDADVTGGLAPYTFNPGPGLDGQLNSQPFGHCSDVHGVVTVTSADGQTVAAPWYYHDVACPTPTATR